MLEVERAEFAASSRVKDSGRAFRWVWSPVNPVQRVWKLGEGKKDNRKQT